MAKKKGSAAQGTALSLVRVPFKDGWIEAARDESGVVRVPLRPFCELFGLGFSSQLQKLKGKTWATVTMNNTVADDGKSREMVMIDDTTFSMWLATIEPARVKAELRPHLEEHQREAARALRAYFFPVPAPVQATPATTGEPSEQAPSEASQAIGGGTLDASQRQAIDALMEIARSSQKEASELHRRIKAAVDLLSKR